jgi:hypothetical protein
MITLQTNTANVVARIIMGFLLIFSDYMIIANGISIGY